ncbi:flavoprotein [Fusobacterium pseudoperiodonticum]|uniref:flavoprotein n=1 Tax=Fusobacterium pseudoperiodonticum TaxID=2663009 RepID=UPI000C1BEBD6|nr:flavoprotein [Fusobacterium pseudoperiodonticum]ATV67983.1 flavoprotein [Fusobacterium pseudoperiodonticum]
MELDKIIEYIVQEVVKKINSQNIIEEFSPKEKILVAITGSTNNLEQIILELRKISKNYDLSLVFSEAASNIINENVFSEFHIIKDFSIKNYDEILSKNDIILLPLLTKNTVAKLVVGIRDNAVTNLVSKALLLEKRVIAAYDSCIVNNEVPYAKLINSNVEKLKDYGLIFVQAKELADYMLNKKDLEINSLREKNVIAAKDLKDLYNKKIIISKNTVVTTLAKERAKENNIVFEEK